MSQVAIRSALETRLATLSPAIDTAYENAPFKVPAPSTPYQRVFLLFADTDNPETGAGYRELGVMVVQLFYPKLQGSSTAAARAKSIRDLFPRGLSLTSSGVVVTIDKTPSIGSGRVDNDRWFLPVKAPFYANLFS